MYMVEPKRQLGVLRRVLGLGKQCRAEMRRPGGTEEENRPGNQLPAYEF
jgi:hypothetical protein